VKTSKKLKNLSSYAVSEVLKAVVMNFAIFWNIAPCIQYMNRRFGGTYNLHLQGRKSVEQETIVPIGG
jgi:hypothetical protein